MDRIDDVLQATRSVASCGKSLEVPEIPSVLICSIYLVSNYQRRLTVVVGLNALIDPLQHVGQDN